MHENVDTGVCDWLFDGRYRGRYDNEDLSRFARVLCRPCKQCGVRPGDKCITASGHVIEDLDKLHMARRGLLPF